MKNTHMISIVAVVLMLCLVVGMMGCALGKGRGVENMMRKIPESAANFAFIDVKALRGGADLKDIYEEWSDGFDSAFGDYGIYFDDVNRIAEGAVKYNEFYCLIDGDFNVGVVRDKLRYLDFHEGEYLDVEIWDSSFESSSESVAFTEDLVIVGSRGCIRDCIGVTRGEDLIVAKPECQSCGG